LGPGQFATGPQGTNTRAYLNELIDSNLFVFYKMLFVDGLRSVESMIKKNKGAKVLAQLRDNRDVLFNLGKVIAADFFIGNHDRFGPNGEIVNAGNIAFQKMADKTYKALGVDFFEAQGANANLTQPPRPGWPGAKLGDPANIRILANNVILNLNNHFQAAAGGAIPNDQLIRMLSVGTLINGMTVGANDLKTYLQTRIRAGKATPSGITKRMQLLGW
jgi:hypothetical protein